MVVALGMSKQYGGCDMYTKQKNKDMVYMMVMLCL